jgi:hypothetical protein
MERKTHLHSLTAKPDIRLKYYSLPPWFIVVSES